jgi:trk system potassium uptake protein TrkA
MRVFIVGAGEVGTHIASALSREGHDLVVVERDKEKVRQLQSQLDVLAVRGDGCNARILETHGVERADLFFAVSNDDAANLLCALTARKLGAPRCVVRVGRPHHGSNPLLKADPEILALYPERLVAAEIQGLTRVPGASKAHFFADGKLCLLKAPPDPSAPIYGRPLRELQGPEGWILTGIRRGEQTIIPRGDTRLLDGDIIYAVGRTETAHGFLSSIGIESRPTRRVVIAGGGHVGYWLSRVLVKDHVDVTVIQRGARRAFDLAAEVPEALVLQGDATDPAMLREAGVDEADYFVAATQDTETNILSSLLAREMGARAEVVLYHTPEFLDVLNAVKIDLPVSPRLMIAGRILRMVHRREIISLDVVEGGDAEVVEFKVPANAKVLKRPLAELRFPKSSIVGAVLRGKELFVPRGAFQFKAKDRALVFTLTDTLPALEKMFRER